MAQVQLYRGSRHKLNHTYLNDGAIYFVPEERRLYIDTATKRLPIVGVAGLSFYIHLKPDNWSPNGQQAASLYYETQKDVTTYELKDILSDESIIFMGQIHAYDDNGNTPSTLSFDELNCIDFSNGQLTFEALNYQGVTLGGGEGNAAVASYDSDPVQPTEDLWVYIYVPNPVVNGLKIDAPCSVVTLTKTLYGKHSFEMPAQWEEGIDGKYYYNVEIEGVDLTSHPFMLGFYDDSLENYKGYWESVIKIDKDSIAYDVNTETSTLKLVSTKKPALNISIFVTSFIYDSIPKEEGQTAEYHNHYTFELDTSTAIENHKVTLNMPDGHYFADIEDGEERVFLCYKVDIDRTDDYDDEGKPAAPIFYNYITDVSYAAAGSKGTITLDISEEYTENSVDGEMQLVVIQANLLANIYDTTLTIEDNPNQRLDWQSYDIESSDGQSHKYYVQRKISSENQVDGEKIKFQFKYSPIIFPRKVEEQDWDTIIKEFNKITEVKVVNKTLYFYAKSIPLIDIPIRVLDFL